MLAAAVGPVPVQAGRKRKRELLVLLGLRCPEDEVGLLASFAIPIGCSEQSYGTLWWEYLGFWVVTGALGGHAKASEGDQRLVR